MLRPNILLHLEGLTVLVLSVWMFAQWDISWVWFAVLFLAPDLFMVGYLASPRVGASVYNLAHTYIPPVFLYVAVFYTDHRDLAPLAFIWTAHIGFDRLLGYGIKYPSAFKDTHLQRI